MIQNMEDIRRRFCAYGMKYKDHEGYTHDWFILLPAVQMAYNTSQHSTTGKSPSLVEEWWNPLLPVDHLKKNLPTINPTVTGALGKKKSGLALRNQELTWRAPKE
ncbi:hypothetical protein O181_025114 [Austropuccinia psidii MF-1]|uniref:Integrase catalytic domain-containing protein n=1 Tax=Austropuccinia psidii MF-1 TaxID=1389203 RepID=A0A9Q3CHF2_9BASI|nr:hypothetical protein [Austropuccinia psidii MF-1]